MTTQMTTVRPQNGQIAVSRAGFAGTEIEMRRETAAVAVAERARAEVEARYKMAVLRPRSIDEARRRILDHCERVRFAEAARYAKPIAGEKIIGPSIRFVEAALAEYGNVLVQCSVVWDDANERRVEVSVTDLERNISYPKEVVIQKTVERKHPKAGQEILGERLNSYGKKVYLVAATEDDLQVKQGALESKAIRTLGLRILPADIVEEAMDAVSARLRRQDEEEPDAARKRLVDAFAALGVYPRALADYLGHDIAASTPAQLEDLRIVYQTLAAGEASWVEILEVKQGERQPQGDEGGASQAPAKPASKAKAALEKRRAKRAEKKRPAAEKPAAAEKPEAQPADELPPIPPPDEPAGPDSFGGEDPPHNTGVTADEPDPLEAEVADLRAELEGGNVSDEIRQRIGKLPDPHRSLLTVRFDEVSKGRG